jgi:hypothetical protein
MRILKKQIDSRAKLNMHQILQYEEYTLVVHTLKRVSVTDKK